MLGFADLLEELRNVRPLPRWMAQPERFSEVVEAFLAYLPPRRYGPCLRRSLLLLDLWSRCGLEPTLHLGFAADVRRREGHAWLTALRSDGVELRVSGPLGTTTGFEL